MSADEVLQPGEVAGTTADQTVADWLREHYGSAALDAMFMPLKPGEKAPEVKFPDMASDLLADLATKREEDVTITAAAVWENRAPMVWETILEAWRKVEALWADGAPRPGQVPIGWRICRHDTTFADADREDFRLDNGHRFKVRIESHVLKPGERCTRPGMPTAQYMGTAVDEAAARHWLMMNPEPLPYPRLNDPTS